MESRASVPSQGAYIPRNVIVSHPAIRGALDIRWDDASQIDPSIVGYNIYRSQVELVETFRRVNRGPVQANFYRDGIRDDTIVEDVSDQFVRMGDYHGDPNDRFDRIGIDTSRWRIVDPDEILSQQGSLRFRDGYGLSRLAYAESEFLLEGDFDIEVSYVVHRLDEILEGEAGGFLWLTLLANGGVRLVRRRTVADNGLAVERVAPDGSVTTLAFRAAADLAHGRDVGRLRIVRSGTDFTFAYDDGDEIVLLHSESGLGDEIASVRIGGLSGKNDSVSAVDAHIEFSRWIVHEGTAKAWVSPDPNMWLQGGEQSPPDQTVVDSAFVIRLSHAPVVDDRGQNRATDDPAFVSVTVDGREAKVSVLNGVQGRVAVSSFPVYDDALGKWTDKPLPKFGSRVTAQYKTNTNVADTSLDRRLFYRVTAVCECADGGRTETELSKAPAARLGGDGMTYYWEEAVRRNKWILEQGGQRCQLFITKKVGTRCPQCQDVEHTHDHPRISCDICFGTGFVGGYEGPYDIIISPPFGESRVEHTERGHRFIRQPEVWMTSTPLVCQQDFLFLRDGHCYLVGTITHVEVRNHTVLQQHFSISALDSSDRRYSFVQRMALAGVMPTESAQSLKGTDQHPLGKEIRQDGTSRKHSVRRAPDDTTFENHLY